MILTKSTKIAQFNKVFSELKASFEGEIVLQTAFVSFRSADKIENMGSYSLL
jgi:hypothetical protein